MLALRDRSLALPVHPLRPRHVSDSADSHLTDEFGHSSRLINECTRCRTSPPSQPPLRRTSLHRLASAIRRECARRRVTVGGRSAFIRRSARLGCPHATACIDRRAHSDPRGVAHCTHQHRGRALTYHCCSETMQQAIRPPSSATQPRAPSERAEQRNIRTSNS
jgi:hypothetical protein